MVQHVIVDCGSLVALRNQMWDNLTDILGVHYAMTLFQKCDANVTDIFLGGQWELDIEPTMADSFRCCIANTFHQIYQILRDLY
jgi:hypothetical protein